MDNNNPLNSMDQARANLNFSDLDRMKTDLKTKYTGVSPKGISMPEVSSGVDLIGALNKERNSKIDLAPNEIRQGDVYENIGGEMFAKFDTYIPGIDNQEYQAQNQTTASKWTNGLTKLGLKTGTAVIGGTAGSVSGLFNAIQEGSLSGFYTDDVNKWIDETNEKLDNQLPNYYTKQEREKGFLESMGTANFWANDVLGGLSFTLGMIVSEGIWAYATGGTSLLAKGIPSTLGRWSSKALGTSTTLKGLSKYKEVGKGLLYDAAAIKKVNDIKTATTAAGKIPKLLNQARFIYTSAGYEAGVESRHYMKELEDQFLADFQEREGRKPNQQELTEFYTNTAGSANTVFGANLALVGSSNMAVFGKMLMGSSTKPAINNSFIKRELFGTGYTMENGIATAAKATRSQKIAGKAYSILRAPVIEGVYEEGGQAVAATAVKDYMLHPYNPEATQENYGMIDSVMEGLRHTYGTKEGFKEVGIGMIIGAIGGGISTGGRFNEVSSERENIQKAVEYRNEFSPERVMTSEIALERMKASNRIYMANKAQQKAKANGDMTGEFISGQQAIIASIERDSILQGTKQGIKDFETYLSTMNNAELADELDMTIEEVEQWKSDKLSEYKELSSTYKKNEAYVRALFGNGELAGMKKLNNSTENVIRALTYNMTIGEQSKAFTKKLAEDIKTAVADEVSFEDFTGAMDVDFVLSNVARESVGQYMNLSKKMKALEGQRRALENEITSEQYNKGKSDSEAYNNKLNSLQKKIISVENQIEELQVKKDSAFRALGIKSDVITQEELDAQSENVKALKEQVEGFKKSNPELYTMLTKLFDEYNKAKDNTVNFNNMTTKLLDPDFRTREVNGWLSKLILKNKSFEESTAEFFKKQQEVYDKNRSEGKSFTDSSMNDRVQQEQPEEEEKDGDSIEVNDEEIASEVPLAQRLRNQIENILTKNPYAVAYIGNNYDEAVKRSPSKEDKNRYEELLGKLNGEYLRKFNALMNTPEGYYAKEDTGISEEEREELKQLQEKLSGWRVLEGSVDGEGNSVADLILNIKQLEATVEKENTKTELNDKDHVGLKMATEKEASSNYEVAAAVQSPDQVMVMFREVDGEVMYSFSHLNIESLTRLFPNSTLSYIQNGVSKSIDSITANKFRKVAKKKGEQFVLETPEGVVTITIGEHSRLNFNKESLDKLINSSNIAIVNYSYGTGNYLDVYERLDNGDLVPLRGDFTYESTLNNEVLEIDPEVVNNLQEGQVLITRVNRNDAYNKSLLNSVKDLKNPTEEEITELMNNLNIYVTDQEGKLVGSLRAVTGKLKANTSTNTLLELRRKAVDMILDESIQDDFFNLNEAIETQTILIGSPNFVVEETEEGWRPKTIEFTDTALNQVVDSGYYENGTVNTRKVKGDNIVKHFLPKESTEKIPVVILNVNGKNVAFPVTLKPIEGNRVDEVSNILSTDLSISQKIVKINNILIESGLRPDSFNLSSENFQNRIGDVIEALENVKDYANIEEWARPNYNLNRLQEEAKISIDLDNKPFNTSKVILDMNSSRSLGDVEQLEIQFDNIENRELSLIDDLQSYARTIEQGKQGFPNVMSGAFVETIDNKPFVFEGTFSTKLGNVNRLIEATSARIPKAVKQTYGEDFFNELKDKLKQYKDLVEFKKKVRSEIKNKELQNQVNNQNTEC